MTEEEGVCIKGKELSFHALYFLLCRTDFKEPWMGIGFATDMRQMVLEAVRKKAEGNPIRVEVVEGALLLKGLGK